MAAPWRSIVARRVTSLHDAYGLRSESAGCAAAGARKDLMRPRAVTAPYAGSGVLARATLDKHLGFLQCVEHAAPFCQHFSEG